MFRTFSFTGKEPELHVGDLIRVFTYPGPESTLGVGATFEIIGFNNPEEGGFEAKLVPSLRVVRPVFETDTARPYAPLRPLAV